MNLPYLLPPLITSVFASIILAALVIKGRRGTASSAFSIIVLATLLWGVCIYGMRASPDAAHALPWDKATVVIIFAMFIFYYHFSAALTGVRRNRIALMSTILLLILSVALSPTDLLVKDVVVTQYGYAPVLGPGIYILYTNAFFMVWAFYNLIKAYKSSKEYEHRNRLLYVILAMIVPVVASIPEMFPDIYPTAIFGNIAFCLIASVAIFRYHLFDVRIMLRRGLSYILISCLVVAPYVIFILILSWVLGNGQVPLWVYIVLLLLLAFLIQPLWRRVQRVVDRLFYRGRYDHLTALENFSKECTHIIDIETLCSRLVSLTPAAMGTSMAHLIMHDGDENKYMLAASSISGSEIGSTLDNDSAIVAWLERNDRPLRRSEMDFSPMLEAVTAEERNLLERIRADLLVPFRYAEKLSGILILSPKVSEEPYGADDIAALMVLARHASTAIENAHLYAQYQQMAVIDELTGLYNRRHFYDVLETEIARTTRYGGYFSLIMLDLDGFKEYNDKFGHINGDAVIRSLGQTLKLSLRKSDISFRYGGDEFAVVLAGTDSKRAKRVIERIRIKWLQHPKALYPMLETPLGFSAGIAQFPENGATADGLVFIADTALYHAKSKGGYRTMLASDMESISPEILQTATLDQVYALAATVDAKDPYTYGHSRNVADIAQAIGKEIGLAGKELTDLYAVSLLHDIGKLGVPDAILTKPGKLTEEEWEIIKRHSAEGERIVSYVKDLSALVHMIRHHHEWYDGSGYPDGLKGGAIPLGARIISVADAYDTMTGKRPYKGPISHEEAAEELRRCSGTQFDPELVQAFIRVSKEQK